MPPVPPPYFERDVKYSDEEAALAEPLLPPSETDEITRAYEKRLKRRKRFRRCFRFTILTFLLFFGLKWMAKDVLRLTKHSCGHIDNQVEAFFNEGDETDPDGFPIPSDLTIVECADLDDGDDDGDDDFQWMNGPHHPHYPPPPPPPGHLPPPPPGPPGHLPPPPGHFPPPPPGHLPPPPPGPPGHLPPPPGHFPPPLPPGHLPPPPPGPPGHLPPPPGHFPPPGHPHHPPPPPPPPGHHGRHHRHHHDHDDDDVELETVTSFFNLPLDSDLHFLLSRGAAVGNVTVIQSDETGDSIEVMTRVHYHRKRVLKHVKVCQVEGSGEGENGVGIFVRKPHHRRRHHHKKHLKFEVVVAIPKPSGDDKVNIQRFHSDMPVFGHKFDNFDHTVSFGTVYINSVFGVVAGGLTADRTEIDTKVGGVYGNFTVTEEIKIISSVGGIVANITLINDDEDSATEASLQGATGAIAANFTLASTSDEGKGGSFAVSSEASVGAQSLFFSNSPVGHKLTLEAEGKVGTLVTKLPSTYEGSFEIQSSPFAKHFVAIDEEAEDPDERGRQRTVEVEEVGRRKGGLKGSVYWDEDGKERGSVYLRGGLGAVRLFA